jgi:thimet oligopeptidase
VGGLSLPRDPDAAAWTDWLSARTTAALEDVRRLAAELRSSELSEGTTASSDVVRDVLDRWNDLQLALRNVFSVASVLANVHPDGSVRDLAERIEQDASRLSTELELDPRLFEVLGAVAAGGHALDGLDGAARRVVDLGLRDFRRAGVDRSDRDRARLRELAARETELAQAFARHLRDDVRTLGLPPTSLEGLPADYVDAHPPGNDGLVAVTTDYPDYVPFMTFSRDRGARARLVREFLDRAYPANAAVLHELLVLRREHARLLGYDGWPEFDAEVKMIGSGEAIPAFIDRITTAADAAARADVAELLVLLRRDVPEADAVDAVDRMHYAEVLRRERFDVDAQEVRRYFSFAKVREGLLRVTGRLFDVDYVEVDDASAWHEDVATYDVVRGGVTLGRIRLDLHPRAGKYGHAAMFELVPGLAGRQLPEGVLVCNFSRGLMEHSHVVTLFHEFGHLVHLVLAGGQRWTRFSGVATEWDFVEAPSQMLEEWAWDADVLASFATDETGHAIPADLVARMRSAQELGKAAHARTQMFYAALSYRLHQDVPDDLAATTRELQASYDVFRHVPGTHFFASFGHLTGYGSAYYTYMWSLVIAKDLLSAFDPDDLLATDVAHRYRDAVLAPGGSRDAADLVADFLGRHYDFRAFLSWLER